MFLCLEQPFNLFLSLTVLREDILSLVLKNYVLTLKNTPYLLHRDRSINIWETVTDCWENQTKHVKYDGRLQSSWTHLITPSWNYVEVR